MDLSPRSDGRIAQGWIDEILRAIGEGDHAETVLVDAKDLESLETGNGYRLGAAAGQCTERRGGHIASRTAAAREDVVAQRSSFGCLDIGARFRDALAEQDFPVGSGRGSSIQAPDGCLLRLRGRGLECGTPFQQFVQFFVGPKLWYAACAPLCHHGGRSTVHRACRSIGFFFMCGAWPPAGSLPLLHDVRKLVGHNRRPRVVAGAN